MIEANAQLGGNAGSMLQQFEQRVVMSRARERRRRVDEEDPELKNLVGQMPEER